MYRSARGLAVPRRRARTHRRDLEPRRVIGVIAEHGHVVPLSGFLRATATPGVSASHARCRVTIGTGEIRGNEVSGSIDRARVRGFGRPGSRVRARERSIQGTHRTRPRGGSRGSCWTSRSRSNAVINERNARAAGKRASPLRPLSRNRGALCFDLPKASLQSAKPWRERGFGGESRARLTKTRKSISVVVAFLSGVERHTAARRDVHVPSAFVSRCCPVCTSA
jgi:hypothetical protein